MLIRFLKSYIFTRRFLFTIIILGVLFLAFGGHTYATGEIVDKTEVVGLVDLVLKVVYILLRPLLVIAGLSLDNTLIYGSFIHMDAPLRAFWNIMKNFANFALGFLVLFAIIRKIFSFGKAGDKREPQKVITQTLIAGVLIQISRFVVGMLVDLSTVATYAVGALPLNIISSTPLGQHKIMSAHVELDLSKFQKVVDGNDYFKVRTSVPNPNGGPDLKFSECKTQNGYIVGRMEGSSGFRNGDVYNSAFGGTKNACVKGGQLVFFNEFPNARLQDTSADYKKELDEVLHARDDGFRRDREACQFIVKPSGKPETQYTCGQRFNSIIIPTIESGYKKDDPGYSIDDDDSFSWLRTPQQYFIAGGLENSTEYGSKYGDTRLQNNSAALTLDKIVDKSKGFVGPLITMYSSMLDFSQLANTSNDTSFGEIGGEMLIKVGFAIGLFFPLLALAIVLIIRVGFMRAVIVLSPFLVLLQAFGLADKMGESLKKHFNVANVVKVIFAPVITVFALSISLVFMSALMASIKTGGVTGLGTTLTTSEGGSQIYGFFKDCMELKLDGFDFGGALDVFSWFLVNMVGIGLMRGIVFAAIKSNSIGEKIGGQVQTFGSNFFQTLPILPVPGGEPVGLGSFGKVMGELPQKYVEHREREQEQRVKKWIKLPGEETTTTGLKTTQIQNIVQGIATGGTPEAVVTKEANVEAGAVTETIQNNLPALFEAASKMENKEQGKNVINVLETSIKDTNAYEKYTIDNAVKDGMTLQQATDAIGNLTVPTEPADKTALINEKITKKLDNTDYVLTIGADNKYAFTPKNTTPAGN